MKSNGFAASFALLLATFGLVFVGCDEDNSEPTEPTPEAGTITVRIVNAEPESILYCSVFDGALTTEQIQSGTETPLAQCIIQVDSGGAGQTVALSLNQTTAASFTGGQAYKLATLLDVVPTDYDYLIGTGTGPEDKYGLETTPTVDGNILATIDADAMIGG